MAIYRLAFEDRDGCFIGVFGLLPANSFSIDPVGGDGILGLRRSANLITGDGNREENIGFHCSRGPGFDDVVGVLRPGAGEFDCKGDTYGQPRG